MTRPIRVALIIMPFAAEDGPALGAALLQAGLARRGIPCRIFHLNLRFAVRIGLERYRAIDRLTSLLLGERLFARALSPEGLTSTEEFAREILHEENAASAAAELDVLHAEAESFIEECRHSIPWHEFEIIGFSSSFQQNTASLALAARLRADHPRLRLVMGGANCEGEMGEVLIESFPFLDAVVSGEADESFPLLVEAFRAGREGDGIPGVLTRGPDGRVRGECAPPVTALDSLATPSFDDYYADLASSNLDLAPSATHLRYETARGCWWGERAHCTFCGLNGGTMAFRRKSPARVLEELDALSRYPTRSVLLSDNILGRDAYSDLLPLIAERRLGLSLFFETKAPISRAEMALLRDAGTRRIQPGIESLSTPTLGRMRKGTRAIENIALLKWASEYGIALTWNLLAGFPREREEEHESMEDVVRDLSHLQPPTGLYEVQIHRFAPFHRDPEVLGIGPIRPLAAYRHIYPFDAERLNRIAYYFERINPAPRPLSLARLAKSVTNWKGAAARGGSAFLFADNGEEIIAFDARDGRATDMTRWSGVDRRLILACDAPMRLNELRDAFEGEREVHDLEIRLAALTRAGLLLHLDERWLTLAEQWEITVDPETDLRSGIEIAGRRLAALSREGAG